MKLRILVVGGAGYIGSHMCRTLARNGYEPIALDNLIYGHREAVKWGPLVVGDLDNAAVLDDVFTRYDVAGVMHFAAFTYVGESVENPAKYYRNNVAATLRLLEAMTRHQIPVLLFSSSCAVYGEPVVIPMTEEHPQLPINPYGRTKLMVEGMLADFRVAHGLRSTSMRYFNAAGADPDGELGEDHQPETHLIPLVLQAALGRRDGITMFGSDYPTLDGTCVRDYIHVSDLAQAHLLALERLLDGAPGTAYNLGNGEGYSVREVVESARRVTGRPIPATVVARRPGDPPFLVGSSQKARRELGWTPAFPDLDTIIRTAWAWHERHPAGYSGE